MIFKVQVFRSKHLEGDFKNSGVAALVAAICLVVRGVNPSMQVLKREALLSPDTISVVHGGKCFVEQNQNKLFI